jgi:hypothetical protein
VTLSQLLYAMSSRIISRVKTEIVSTLQRLVSSGVNVMSNAVAPCIYIHRERFRLAYSVGMVHAACGHSSYLNSDTDKSPKRWELHLQAADCPRRFPAVPLL